MVQWEWQNNFNSSMHVRSAKIENNNKQKTQELVHSRVEIKINSKEMQGKSFPV